MKWPNDVLVDGRKVAGVLVEGRPQDGWAVVGIGVNVTRGARRRCPARGRWGATDVEAVLAELLAALEVRLGEPHRGDADRAAGARRAARRRACAGTAGAGVGDGIDADGGLRVRTAAGGVTVLSAGEVHLGG